MGNTSPNHERNPTFSYKGNYFGPFGPHLGIEGFVERSARELPGGQLELPGFNNAAGPGY